VFHAQERGRAARDELMSAGYQVDFIDNQSPAAEVTHHISERGGEGPANSAASGATLGGLAGGGIGAVPGAILGRVVGNWLTEKRSEEYEQDVANGGAVVIVHAEELAPAAKAESMLYQLGADHVENGERPVS
jgi:hypothetical protein